MSSTGGAVIPVVLWGRTPPAHSITSTLIDYKDKFIITGCRDGQICLWDLQTSLQVKPKVMLFGHTSSITCLAKASKRSDRHLFVSSTDNGEMCLWDLHEMICVEHTKMNEVHSSIESYNMINSSDLRLFCNGKYPEILIMNPLTLTVLCKLVSNFSPDWISAISVLKAPKGNQDVVVGLTVTGVARVWTIDENSHRISDPPAKHMPLQEICENEAKPLRAMPTTKGASWCLKSNVFGQRIMLIVNSRAWQLYDAFDFSLLTTVPTSDKIHHWIGGDFIAKDKVIIWCSDGHAYLYQLPDCSIPNKQNFRAFVGSPVSENLPELREKGAIPQEAIPKLQLILKVCNENEYYQPQHHNQLLSPPSFSFMHGDDEQSIGALLVRGDCEGRICVWKIPAESSAMMDGNQSAISYPTETLSIEEAWRALEPPPPGIIDQLNYEHSPTTEVQQDKVMEHHYTTASLYIPALGKLVCGREDGSIVYVTACQTLFLQLLENKQVPSSRRHQDWPPYRMLHPGHDGAVTCILHPNSETPSRYDKRHLLSGGVDFCVKLWDMEQCALLTTFVHQSGDILQLLVPPNGCNSRILNCVASVASDHSVALLSLKEKKCVLLASRHLFPIQTVKWRSKDDYMIVYCSDGSCYVWQMENGVLDRVVKGSAAEEILQACEHVTYGEQDQVEVNEAATQDNQDSQRKAKTNATLQFVRAIRHRNLAVARQAAERGLQKLQQQGKTLTSVSTAGYAGWSGEQKSMPPMIIQGLRTGGHDKIDCHESHVLLFDVEGIVVQLLTEENDPEQLHAMKQQQLAQQQKEEEEESQKNEIAGAILSKAKEFKGKADAVSQKLQAATSDVIQGVQGVVNIGPVQRKVSFSAPTPQDASKAKFQNNFNQKISHQKRKQEIKFDTQTLNESAHSLTMQIAQLMLSLLHAWGISPQEDDRFMNTLGLLRPTYAVNYGILSRAGYMSVLLPCYPSSVQISSQEGTERNEAVDNNRKTRRVVIKTRLGSTASHCCEHWSLSSSLTTNHLIAVIAIANTLMRMNNATFVMEQERKRKLVRRLTRQASKMFEVNQPLEIGGAEYKAQQQRIQGEWKQLARLHCEHLALNIRSDYRPPHLEMLVRRWQDRCMEIRDAARALLLAELIRIGPSGRKAVVESWAQFLPDFSQNKQHRHKVGAGILDNESRRTSTVGSTIGSSSHTSSMTNINQADAMASSQTNAGAGGNLNFGEEEENDMVAANTQDDELGKENVETTDGPNLRGNGVKVPATTYEYKRRQAFSVVLLGVIGAEFGGEVVGGASGKDNVVGGFSAPAQTGDDDYSLARATSRALSYLILHPPDEKLPPHTALRRAAIDLIGRGFTVWEPYLDVNNVLLSLLRMCSDAERLLGASKQAAAHEGSGGSGTDQSAPPLLSPAADSARSARRSLSIIALARPNLFITVMATEVARYNALAQSAQTMQVNLSNAVVVRARREIMNILALLIEFHPGHVLRLLQECVDVVLHCVDAQDVKQHGLVALFPPLGKYSQISFCKSSHRLAVGGNRGTITLHELSRLHSAKGHSQVLKAHSQAVTALSFSPDGRSLVSYSAEEKKLLFWSTAQNLFGLGQAPVKVIRIRDCSVVSPDLLEEQFPSTNYQIGDTLKPCPYRPLARFHWKNNKEVICMSKNGTEQRFSL